MSIINLQHRVHNCQEAIYNIGVSNFDARKFADWLEKAFRGSNYKSYSELADNAGLKRSTVSSLVTAKPQTATGKPSQPKADTVMKLARALNEDVDRALLEAGHAPTNIDDPRKPRSFPELIEALEKLGIEIPGWATRTDFSDYTEDDFEGLKRQIAADVGVRIKPPKD